MKKPFLRQLLAAVLVGVLASVPVTPIFAQEPATPAQTPPPVPPPAQASQPAQQGGIPISLGVSKRDYSIAPSAFPNIINPYRMQVVAPGVLTNSPRLEQLIHDGKMPLSLQDAIALAMENSMDIAVQRYSPWMADVSLLKSQAGLFSYGTPGSIAVESLANLPLLQYDPFITQVINFSDAAIPHREPVYLRYRRHRHVHK